MIIKRAVRCEGVENGGRQAISRFQGFKVQATAHTLAGGGRELMSIWGTGEGVFVLQVYN